MKRCFKFVPAIVAALAAGPAFALGEYNDAIESLCSGHSAAQLFFCKFHQAACFGNGRITLSG